MCQSFGTHIAVTDRRVHPVHMHPVRVDVVDRALLMGLNVPNGIKGMKGLVVDIDVFRNRPCASLEVDPDERIVNKVNAAPARYA